MTALLVDSLTGISLAGETGHADRPTPDVKRNQSNQDEIPRGGFEQSVSQWVKSELKTTVKGIIHPFLTLIIIRSLY